MDWERLIRSHPLFHLHVVVHGFLFYFLLISLVFFHKCHEFFQRFLAHTAFGRLLDSPFNYVFREELRMQFTTLLTTFVQLVEHALPGHFSRRVILILLTPFNFQNYLLVFLISRLRLP